MKKKNKYLALPEKLSKYDLSHGYTFAGSATDGASIFVSNACLDLDGFDNLRLSSFSKLSVNLDDYYRFYELLDTDE